MERFAKIVNDFKPLIIFGKQSILYVWPGFEYVYALAECTNIFTVEYRLTANFWNLYQILWRCDFDLDGL